MTTAGQKKKTVPLPAGPFHGVLTATDEPDKSDRFLYHAANCWFTATGSGSVEMRPPFIEPILGGVLGGAVGIDLSCEDGSTLLAETGVAIAGDGSRKAQCIYEHPRLDGTIDRFLFVNGRMYRWDGAGAATDITPAVAISPTNRISCTTFADVLIVTDGANRPWQYNPATGTATTIPYDTANSAWYAYGRVKVYNGALVFIVGAVAGVFMRSTLVWSEPGQPLVGYRQNGYDNAWELVQTSNLPLTAIESTNNGIVYFRDSSIGLITGAIGSSFKTTAQHDAIADTLGTTTPFAVLLAGDYIWFLDQSGDVYRFRVGSTTMEPIGNQARDFVRYQLEAGLQGTQTTCACSSFVPDLGKVVLCVYSGFNGTSMASSMMVFDVETGNYEGNWTIGLDLAIGALGVMRDSTGNYLSLCVLADDRSIPSDATGAAFFRLRNLAEMTSGAVSWADSSGATVTGVVLGLLGVRDLGNWQFDQVMVRAREINSPGATLSLVGETPTSSEARTLTPTTPSPNGSGSVGGYPLTLAPNLTTAGITGVATAVARLNLNGRWLMCKLTPTTTNLTDLPFSIMSLVVTAVDDGLDPTVT